MKRAGLGSVVLLAFVTACASTARITGDFADYRSYRKTRLATTLEARLAESERYLRDFPRGDYRPEVRRWFFQAEPRYVKLAWDQLPRLRAYLDAMPNGPHAEEVRERVVELESRRVFGERRERRVLERAQSFEQRLAEAASQRREFLHEFQTLTRLLGATRSFGQPTAELDSELLLRFRVRQPPGRCQGDVCTKVFRFVYSVPDDKQLSERTAELTLEIGLDHGLVRRISLFGPELLTRVAEAAAVRAVPPDNPQARAEALGQAVDVVAPALDAPLPEGRCTGEAISPVVLTRHCDGVRLDVVAGTEAHAFDRLQVSAETP